MKLDFGVAVRDFTPAYPVTLHGYRARDHKSVGVLERLCCACLALRSNDLTMLVLTADMVGVHSEDVDELKNAISSATGVPQSNLLFSCSHTHFAPTLGYDFYNSPDVGFVEDDEVFRTRFTSLLIEAARDALANLAPGELQAARTRVPSVMFNRRTVMQDGSVVTNFRYPLDEDSFSLSPVDDELTVLRLIGTQGAGAVLINFGCHAVTGGADSETSHYMLSSDYVDYARRQIEAHFHCPVLFTLGAAGDAVPLDRLGGSRQLIGSTLAAAAVLAERKYRPVSPENDGRLGAVLTVSERSLLVRTIFETDGETARAEYETARSEARANESSETKSAAIERYRHAAMRYFRARLYPDNTYTVHVQFINVGSLRIVALPFEVLAEFSLRIKQEFPQTIVVSCANGYQGYLPFTREYARGGYEATDNSTHFEQGTAERLLELVREELSGSLS